MSDQRGQAEDDISAERNPYHMHITTPDAVRTVISNPSLLVKAVIEQAGKPHPSGLFREKNLNSTLDLIDNLVRDTADRKGVDAHVITLPRLPGVNPVVILASEVAFTAAADLILNNDGRSLVDKPDLFAILAFGDANKREVVYDAVMGSTGETYNRLIEVVDDALKRGSSKLESRFRGLLEKDPRFGTHNETVRITMEELNRVAAQAFLEIIFPNLTWDDLTTTTFVRRFTDAIKPNGNMLAALAFMNKDPFEMLNNPSIKWSQAEIYDIMFSLYTEDLKQRNRRKSGGEDDPKAENIMQQLLDAGGTFEESMATVVNLVAASYETYSTTTMHIIRSIAIQKELGLWERIATEEDTGLMTRLVYEGARLAPLRLSLRQAYEDTVILGVPIQRGTMILPLLGYPGQDPKIFTNPGRFDPDRYAGDRGDELLRLIRRSVWGITPSNGRITNRSCPGYGFAVAAIRSIMRHTTRHFECPIVISPGQEVNHGTISFEDVDIHLRRRDRAR